MSCLARVKKIGTSSLMSLMIPATQQERHGKVERGGEGAEVVVVVECQSRRTREVGMSSLPGRLTYPTRHPSRHIASMIQLNQTIVLAMDMSRKACLVSCM